MVPPGWGLEGLVDAVRAISLSLFSTPSPPEQASGTSSPPYFPLWPPRSDYHSQVLIGRVPLQDANLWEYGFATSVTQ